MKNIFKVFTCNTSHAFSLNRKTLLHLNVSMSKMPSIAKTINVNIIGGWLHVRSPLVMHFYFQKVEDIVKFSPR